MRRALSFLTVFGSARTPNDTTLVWFPFVGVLLGLSIGVIWWLAAKAWPPVTAAAVVVVADLVLTGLLHVDGVADSGDGLLAPLSREQRLAAMADPSIGAFGAISVGAILLLRYGALAAQRPSILAIAGIWCASRTCMVVMTQSLPYARSTGLVTSFLTVRASRNRARVVLWSVVAIGLIGATSLLVAGRGFRGLCAMGGELAGVALVAGLARRRLGGFTGDVLGAAGVVGETVALIVLAIR